MRLALRWVVFKRRYEVAESTIRSDLSALRQAYRWGEREFPTGLEGRLETGALTYDELQRLDAWLRHAHPGRLQAAKGELSPDGVPTSMSKREAQASIGFLIWALIPVSRNERGAPPPDSADLAAKVQSVLGPLVSLRLGSSRIIPLPEDAAEAVEKALGPRLDRTGSYARPIQFRRDNPFRRSVRHRNWLLWRLLRDCGIRFGEALKLQIDDFPRIDGETLRARRPPSRRSRRHPPEAAAGEDAQPDPAPFSEGAQGAARLPHAGLHEPAAEGRGDGSQVTDSHTGSRASERHFRALRRECQNRHGSEKPLRIFGRSIP